MKRLLTVTTALLMLAAPMGEAMAQGWNNGHDRRDDRRGGPGMMMQGHNNNDHRRDWRKGGRIERNDWNRGSRVDYRRYKLQRPPRGYEWRRVDNNYVLAAVATGLIASVLLANR